MSMAFYGNYEIKKEFKYLVYFFGNFSLPHKGHLSLIEKYFNLANVHILVSVFGDENRHNVPTEAGLKIWEIYLKDVKNLTVKKHDPTFKDIFFKKNKKKIDIILHVRGYEENNPIVTNPKSYYSELITKCRKKGMITHFLFIKRIPEICSSNFIKDIRNTKFENYIYKYLPDNLSETDINKVKEIIEKI